MNGYDAGRKCAIFSKHESLNVYFSDIFGIYVKAFFPNQSREFLIKLKPMNDYIAVVETIMKKREPLPAMEAIYLITPNEESISELKKDFASQHRTMYRAAHVYFTEGKHHI